VRQQRDQLDVTVGVGRGDAHHPDRRGRPNSFDSRDVIQYLEVVAEDDRHSPIQEDVAKKVTAAPNGLCWDDCGGSPKPGSFFLRGHDKRANRYLAAVEGSQSIALRLAARVQDRKGALGSDEVVARRQQMAWQGFLVGVKRILS